MAFIDDLKKSAKELGEKATEVGKDLYGKASDSVEIGKLNIKIGEENSKIEKTKLEIGELVWTMFEAGDIKDEKLADLCNKVKESLAVIADFQAKIEEIKKTEDKPE